jgi:homoserine kinase type II
LLVIDVVPADVLAIYPRHLQPLCEPEFLGGAGGLSGARLWRYRSAERLVIVRAWPPHGPGRRHLEQVHRWLMQTEPLRFVPRPIPDRFGRTLNEFRGRLWELAPWMAGEVESSRPPATGRLRAACAGMAAFHQRLAAGRRDGVSAGLRDRFASVERLMDGGIEDLARTIQHLSGPGEPGRRESACQWLELAHAVTPALRDDLRDAAGRVVPLQPCLRDARPEHFLFEGDRLSGLVDFGAMGIDCVACDLARLLGEWLDGDPAAGAYALNAYECVRALDAAEASLIGTFDRSAALLSGEHWIRWHYREGRSFDRPEAVDRGIARSVERLKRIAEGARAAPGGVAIGGRGSRHLDVE